MPHWLHMRAFFTSFCTLLFLIMTPVAFSAEPGAAVRLPPQRPVVLTSDSILEKARARMKEGEGAAAMSWEKTRARADAALREEFIPYQGEEYLRYYRTGRDQAQFIRDLALAYCLLGEEKYGARAKQMLLDWSDEFHRLYNFPDHYPAVEIPHAAGLVIGRTVLIFADAYALLWPLLNEGERERVETWFRGLVPPIKESMRLWEVGEYHGMKPPYFGQQYFNNHLGACNMGLAAIGFALRDRELISYAMEQRPEAAARPFGEVDAVNRRDLQTLIEGVILMPGDFGSEEEGDVLRAGAGDPSLKGAPPPLPGETWDRYRVRQGKGIHYTLLHLRVLTLTAEMGYQNLNTPHYSGEDFFRFIGRRGENLRVSYEVYADWFTTLDPAAVNNGYYVSAIPGRVARETVTQNLDMLALYELAARRYPDSQPVRAALRARDEAGERVVYDRETFAWTAALLYAGDSD